MKEKWIEDSVQKETAVARKRLEDAEPANKQEQDDMTNAEKAGLTTSKPETPFEEMLNAIGDSLSDIASSDDQEDGEDKDNDGDDPAGGKLSDDDEPGWVMGTISNTVQYRMERFRQMQMKLVEVMHPGWGDATDCFHETDKKYGTTKLKILVVVQPQTVADAASSVPMTSGVPSVSNGSVFGPFLL